MGASMPYVARLALPLGSRKDDRRLLHLAASRQVRADGCVQFARDVDCPVMSTSNSMGPTTPVRGSSGILARLPPREEIRDVEARTSGHVCKCHEAEGSTKPVFGLRRRSFSDTGVDLVAYVDGVRIRSGHPAAPDARG